MRLPFATVRSEEPKGALMLMRESRFRLNGFRPTGAAGDGCDGRGDDAMDEAMEQAVRVAARALADAKLRPDDRWENTCLRVARVAVEAAAPVLAGELIACLAQLLERAEWAESEVVRLRDERDGLRRRIDGPRHSYGPCHKADVEAKAGGARPAG